MRKVKPNCLGNIAMRRLQALVVGVLLLPALLQEPFALAAERNALPRSPSSQVASDPSPDAAQLRQQAVLRELLSASKAALIFRLREAPEDELAEQALSGVIEVEWKEKAPAAFLISLLKAAGTSGDPKLGGLAENLSLILNSRSGSRARAQSEEIRVSETGKAIEAAFDRMTVESFDLPMALVGKGGSAQEAEEATQEEQGGDHRILEYLASFQDALAQ